MLPLKRSGIMAFDEIFQTKRHDNINRERCKFRFQKYQIRWFYKSQPVFNRKNQSEGLDCVKILRRRFETN